MPIFFAESSTIDTIVITVITIGGFLTLGYYTSQDQKDNKIGVEHGVIWAIFFMCIAIGLARCSV